MRTYGQHSRIPGGVRCGAKELQVPRGVTQVDVVSGGRRDGRAQADIVKVNVKGSQLCGDEEGQSNGLSLEIREIETSGHPIAWVGVG